MKVNAYKAVKGPFGPEVVKDSIPSVFVDGRKRGDSADCLYEICRALGMERETEEHLFVFCMDARMRVNAFFRASIGDATSSILAPRVIMRNALMLNACFIALAHNHPSRDPSPSGNDVRGTSSIKQAGDLLGVPLVDHLVVGEGSYVSIRETYGSIWES